MARIDNYYFWLFDTSDDVLKGSGGNDFMLGRLGGNNVFEAGGGDDFILSFSGDDTIRAGTGDDFVVAGDGDDVLVGGAGDDRLFGGRGNDTAIFYGALTAETVERIGASTRVTTGVDGSDWLFGVETLDFKGNDRQIDLTGNNAVFTEADTVALSGDDPAWNAEGTSVTIDQELLTANDFDVDGEDFSITSVTLTDSSAGTLEVTGSGDITFTPSDPQAGETIQFEYTVQDASGATSIGQASFFFESLPDATGSQSGGSVWSAMSSYIGSAVDSEYNVEIIFDTTSAWTESLQGAFIRAANYMSELIIGDVADVGGIDDLRINASLKNIDGTGGVLGQATYTQARAESLLPSEGFMEFDVDDAESLDDDGLFDDVVLHEMFHVAGFGTAWEAMGLVQGGSFWNPVSRFVGENATQAYQASNDSNMDFMSWMGVPLENNGGPGTANVHWEENGPMSSALMSGYLSPGSEVTATTVASMEDLGYETIYDPNDPTATIPQMQVLA